MVGCAAVWLEEEKEAEDDVILPPDVLDTSLAILCAPLKVAKMNDLSNREAHFCSPAATVILRTSDEDVFGQLRWMSGKCTPDGGLSVAVVLEESPTKLGEEFLTQAQSEFFHNRAFGRVNLERTSLWRIGKVVPRRLLQSDRCAVSVATHLGGTGVPRVMQRCGPQADVGAEDWRRVPQ